MYFLFAIYNLIIYLLSMLNKTLKNNLQIGDNVWVYLNKSKIHSGCYGSAVVGKIVGFTKKRIKCETSLGYGANGEEFLIANYLPKNVEPIREI